MIFGCQGNVNGAEVGATRTLVGDDEEGAEAEGCVGGIWVSATHPCTSIKDRDGSKELYVVERNGWRVI